MAFKHGTEYLLFYTIFVNFACADVIHLIKNVLKYSFEESLSICVLSDGEFKPDIALQAIIQIEIPITVIVVNNKANSSSINLRPLVCNNYIILTGNVPVMENVLTGNYRSNLTLEPHKKTLIFSSKNQQWPRKIIDYAVNVKGIDIIEVILNLTLPEVKVNIIRSRKSLLISNNTFFDKKDFAVTKWKPIFKTEATSYTFKVSAFNCRPLIKYHPLRGVYDGIEYMILSTIAKDWPVEFVIHTEIKDPRGLYTLCIDDVVNGTSDIALCSHWQTINIGKNIDMSNQYGQICSTFLVPKPKLLLGWMYIFRPLTSGIWLILLICSCIVGTVLCIAAQFYKNTVNQLLPYVDLSLSYLDSIHLSIYGALHYYKTIAFKFNLRCMCVLLSFQTLLICAAYSAGFASILTYPSYNRIINTLEDMVFYNIYWEAPLDTLDTILKRSGNPNLIRLADLHLMNRTVQEMNREIQDKDVATFVKATDFGYISDVEWLNDYGQNNLKVLSECFLTSYVIIPFKKGSPFLQLFNVHIMNLVEHGHIHYWHMEEIRKRSKYMLNFFAHYLSVKKQKPLTVDHIRGSLCLLGIGYVLAGLVFLGEKILSLINNRNA